LRLKIPKKLRTASLNSEFTGSYKKSVLPFSCPVFPLYVLNFKSLVAYGM